MINPAPLVSVIIPVYNRGYCLKIALESVFSQSFTDYEILVVDDGSTDDTEQVAEGFSDIQYLKIPQNSGVSNARNLGIQKASGRYICFLDSDDLWVPEKLESQVRWMENNPNGAACYTDEIWIRNGVRVNPMKKHQKFSGNIFKHCLPLCIISPSSVMLRASVFNEVGLFDEALPVCEDYDLWLRLSVRHRIHFIPERLIIKIGGHPDQLSRKYWGMDRFRVQALAKLLDENSLGETERFLAIEMLSRKCGILVKGMVKRDKTDEADFYRNLIKKYSSELERSNTY